MEEKKDAVKSEDAVITPQNSQETDQRGRLRSLINKLRRPPKSQEPGDTLTDPDANHGEMVRVSDLGAWGEKFSKEGDNFKLSRLFGDNYSGTSSFDQVYFKTVSGSIWQISDKQITRTTPEGDNEAYGAPDPGLLEGGRLVVGESFFWGTEQKHGLNHTGRISEIVAVVGTIDGRVSRDLPKTDLVDEFNKRIAGDSA